MDVIRFVVPQEIIHVFVVQTGELRNAATDVGLPFRQKEFPDLENANPSHPSPATKEIPDRLAS